jgi:hypothetical protein
MVKRTLLALVVLAAIVPPAFADPEEGGGCTTQLLDCYQAAAKIDSFWYRWAAGFDCELDFAQCTRVKVIGN